MNGVKLGVSFVLLIVGLAIIPVSIHFNENAIFGKAYIVGFDFPIFFLALCCILIGGVIGLIEVTESESGVYDY